MKLPELESELAAGKLRRAYLIAGSEALLRDDALAALRRAALGEGDPTFNSDRLEGAGASAGRLLDALHTRPMFAERRLVLLELPEGRRTAPATLLEALESWASAKEPAESVLVVLASKVDRRLRWVKAFGSAVVECEAPARSRDLAAFAREEAARQGVEFAAGAAEALAERVGPHLLLMRNEIAKLALLAGGDAPVRPEHVAAGTALAAEEPIWDLGDAIAERRGADALGVLGHLLAGGAPPPVLLGSLTSHFRRLLRTSAGAEVPGPPFVRRKLAEQASRYGAGRLRAALGALHQTDLALKGAGGLKPELALERLVIALSA